MLITPPPSSHPNAEKIRSRIRRRVVQASASPLVRDIHAEMDDLRFNVTLDELLAAFGAGPWEPK